MASKIGVSTQCSGCEAYFVAWDGDGCCPECKTDNDVFNVAMRKQAIWPKKSLAWGCSSSQVAKANAEAERRGVRAPYNKDGSCVFDSPGHEKKYYEAFGAYDKEGGYNSPKRGVAFERGWEVQEKD